MFFQFSEHAVKGAFFEHPCAILSAASFEFLGYDMERAKGEGGGAEHIFLCYYLPSIRGQRGIEDVINGVIGEIKLRAALSSAAFLDFPPVLSVLIHLMISKSRLNFARVAGLPVFVISPRRIFVMNDLISGVISSPRSI